MTACLRLIFTLVVVECFVCCQVPSAGLLTEVMGPVLPDSTCQFSVGNPSYQAGYYDPTVDGGAGYQLTLLFRNNMQTPAEETLPSGPLQNLSRRAHDVQITSIDACWYLAGSVDSYGQQNRGSELIDCSTIPNQSARLQAFGHIDEGGMGLVQTTILGLPALRALFGEGYTPQLIPSVGRFSYDDPSTNPAVANGDQNNLVLAGYAFAPQSPLDPQNRSAFWGSKHPTTANVKVVVQMRANMQLQSGEESRGTWFTLPVTVCTGCMQDYCGPLVEAVCARGPCADGTECLSTGKCANTDLTCSPITLYSGARPDFFGQDAGAPCLPAQGFGGSKPLQCVKVGCSADN